MDNSTTPIDPHATTLRPEPQPSPIAPQRRTWVKRMMFTVMAVAGLGAALINLPSMSSSPSLGPVTTHTIQRGDLLVTVTEQGTLESANNTELKNKVRGDNTIISVIESGTHVNAGDELLRLDTLLIEEEISERTKFAHLAESAVARSAADVARAKLAILEYEQGQYVAQLAGLEKDLAVAQSKLVGAEDMLSYAKMMSESGYVNELEVEEKQFSVAQADAEVKLNETYIDVLTRFTKREQLATLEGDLRATEANHKANVETAFADNERLKRAQEEYKHCVIKAERSGMVIYPKGREWEEAPDIEEGATVHKDQVLLLMPDLTNMQVKVGVHESVVDRVSPGLPAKVTMTRKSLDGTISSVASVAKPAGWWTGNVVKYDTIVALTTVEGLKPGMSVEVEIVLAEHRDVVMVPTSAVLETTNGHACWVRIDDQARRRPLKLGDSNDMFIVVHDGLDEGDSVILDPLATVEEAQVEAARAIEADAMN